jgi:hypothetical protein
MEPDAAVTTAVADTIDSYRLVAGRLGSGELPHVRGRCSSATTADKAYGPWVAKTSVRPLPSKLLTW